jgi:hypothetical protein
VDSSEVKFVLARGRVALFNIWQMYFFEPRDHIEGAMKSRYISSNNPQAHSFLIWAKLFSKEYELTNIDSKKVRKMSFWRSANESSIDMESRTDGSLLQDDLDVQ